jgi:hypothetical protein
MDRYEKEWLRVRKRPERRQFSQFAVAFAGTAGFPDHSRARFDTAVWKLLECPVSLEGFPSGQREQTVNLPALPSKVRILPPPPGQELIPEIVERHLALVVPLPESQRLFRGCSSMVEQKPSKLTTRVRFPSPAPETTNIACGLRRNNKQQNGSARSTCPCSSVVEHSLGKGEVERSIRSMGTKSVTRKSGPLLLCDLNLNQTRITGLSWQMSRGLV